jgi:hypothetical protein
VEQLFPPGSQLAAIASWMQKIGWWAHQDLNLEPTDYESARLSLPVFAATYSEQQKTQGPLSAKESTVCNLLVGLLGLEPRTNTL